MPEYTNIRPPRPGPSFEGFEAPSCDYAELDVTTNYSFLRGASHPDELVFRAANLGYRALAVTDVNSLAGVVRAYDACRQVREQGGIPPKLIVGARLTLTDGPDVLAWAPDRPAYASLCRLLTLGKRRAEKGECSLSLGDLLEHGKNLLAAAVATPPLSEEKLLPALFRLRESFGRDRLSLAVSCHYGGDDRFQMDALSDAARRAGVALLASNHVHYHDASRRQLQDVLTCVRHGCTIHDAGYRLFSNGERYLKSPDQMRRLFQMWPEAFHRAVEIAERCTFSLDELKYEYPDEVVPPGMTPITYLSELTWDGAATRYPQGVPLRVDQQIRHELKLIEQLRYEPYFLTVHDLVRFARSRGILCQGRGSAANSAVCYCLGVTAVDPSRVEVLFERFVSSARGEPPDIDIDFEHERREEVIQYVYNKYGRERSGMCAEVITYRGRSAVRDVGKALGLSLDLVDRLAKTLEGWDAGAPDNDQLRRLGLNPADPSIRQVMALTGEILGFPRHLSQHVGGMVMTRGPLCELVPIENASMADRTVIEWDKDDIDSLGILKVDVLGLGMLTCIARCIALVNKTTESAPPLELHTIPAEDKSVYDMVSDADTVGVFQIESRAQMSMLPRLKPEEFYDLVIEVAIVRPGPIQGNMVHPYLRRRNGEEEVVYPSKALESVLSKTLGVPLFQEQAMKVAMVGAGFTAEDADRLRKAMGAWKRGGAIEQFYQKFITGMLANGYDRVFAEQCFEQIRGFGLYGFPESHAASFALLVYASSWLKRYHPASFCCAILNSQPMGFYAPAQLVRDAQEHGVEVRPVDINQSDWDCTLEETQRKGEQGSEKWSWGNNGPAVRLGLRMIKGLRQAHAEQLMRARQQAGPFLSIAQFQRRSDLAKHVIQRLAEADAFGSLNLSRRPGLWHALALDDQQMPLFPAPPVAMGTSVTGLPPMPIGQEVLDDYSTTRLSLKRHPVSLVREELSTAGAMTAVEINALKFGARVVAAGLVLIRQRPGTAAGIIFMTLEDETGSVNLIVRPQIYDRFRAAARHAALMMAEGYVERQDKVVHVMVRRIRDFSHLLRGGAFSSRDFH